jgi:hypothetical protein
MALQFVIPRGTQVIDLTRGGDRTTASKSSTLVPIRAASTAKMELLRGVEFRPGHVKMNLPHPQNCEAAQHIVAVK